MNFMSFGARPSPINADRRATQPITTAHIVRNLAICVTLQLAVTIAFPEQTWSMPMGLAALAFLSALTTLQVGGWRWGLGQFHIVTVAAFFAWKGLAWLIWAMGEQQAHDLAPLLSFMSQFIMTQILVPRGRRYGGLWPAIFDILGGFALCVVVTTRFWSQAYVDPNLIAPRFLQYLEYILYPALALASLIVQRRAPPLFLKAFTVAQCLYALTSIISLEVWNAHFTRNSPIWVYGDISLIVFPLLANAWRYQQDGHTEPDGEAMPNHVIPSIIAFVMLAIAFGYAQRQQTFASLISAAGFLLYAIRVGFVTRQYHKAQVALVAAGRLRVETLMDVVHELRSPLASVVLNASALARAEDVPERLKPRVATIANRCDAVTRLLNDVLDLERIEAGLIEISATTVDARTICRLAQEAVAATADAAGVALHGPIDAVPPFLVEGDAPLLTRVMVNLLDNAVRFTPAGGVIAVSIGPVGTSQIAIVVEDSGVGLSPEAQATLFKRFAHAGNPINGVRGSGLGLSISFSAVEAMRGRLSLVSRKDGPGTRATIVLKRASGQL